MRAGACSRRSDRCAATRSRTGTGRRRRSAVAQRRREDDAEIWLVAFDQHDVAIERGENSGRTLRYHDGVRELTRLADWRGQPVEIELPLARLAGAGRSGAAISCNESDGVIVAGAQVRVPPPEDRDR